MEEEWSDNESTEGTLSEKRTNMRASLLAILGSTHKANPSPHATDGTTPLPDEKGPPLPPPPKKPRWTPPTPSNNGDTARGGLLEQIRAKRTDKEPSAPTPPANNNASPKPPPAPPLPGQPNAPPPPAGKPPTPPANNGIPAGQPNNTPPNNAPIPPGPANTNPVGHNAPPSSRLPSPHTPASEDKEGGVAHDDGAPLTAHDHANAPDAAPQVTRDALLNAAAPAFTLVANAAGELHLSEASKAAIQDLGISIVQAKNKHDQQKTTKISSDQKRLIEYQEEICNKIVERFRKSINNRIGVLRIKAGAGDKVSQYEVINFLQKERQALIKDLRPLCTVGRMGKYFFAAVVVLVIINTLLLVLTRPDLYTKMGLQALEKAFTEDLYKTLEEIYDVLSELGNKKMFEGGLKPIVKTGAALLETIGLLVTTAVGCVKGYRDNREHEICEDKRLPPIDPVPAPPSKSRWCCIFSRPVAPPEKDQEQLLEGGDKQPSDAFAGEKEEVKREKFAPLKTLEDLRTALSNEEKMLPADQRKTGSCLTSCFRR